MSVAFPTELAAFRARTADPGYAALILLGTRQAITAALLLGTLSVPRVAFLLTDETRIMPDAVAALLGCSADGWLCPDGDHSTTLAVYQGLRHVLDQWRDLDRASIAVDVTGGLKPMSLGLEKAAHVLGLQTIYVQSDYHKLPDGRAVPTPATQRLVIPPDPYAVFGDLEAAEAQQLYATYDYSGAQRIFAELAVRVPDTAHDYSGAQRTTARVPDTARPRFAALAAVSAMYAAWDVLDFAGALVHADILLAMPLDQVAALAPHRAQLRAQRAMLHTLVAVSQSVVGRDDDALRTLADPAAILPLLGTLHTNALRRAAQGRYDFAALFRYRCLELISQHRLATHGLLSNALDYARLPLPKADLSMRFQPIQRALGRTQPRGLGKLRSVGMFDGYMLLAALDDPLVRGYAIKQIEERSQARNTSVLAHGYRLIDQAEYASFASVVDEVLDRLFAEVLQQPRAAWEQAVQFVDPFVV